VKAVKILLRYGALISRRNLDGDTPFDLALRTRERVSERLRGSGGGGEEACGSDVMRALDAGICICKLKVINGMVLCCLDRVSFGVQACVLACNFSVFLRFVSECTPHTHTHAHTQTHTHAHTHTHTHTHHFFWHLTRSATH